MRKIEITELDSNLLADLEGATQGWELHEVAADDADGVWQVLWNAEHNRAGLVYVGNGSNGATLWTDAASPADAYRRLQADELSRMSPRGRLTVTPGGPWRLYQHIELPGWQMLGTVQRGHEIGALARNTQTGALVMMRAGIVSMLDQRKAAASLAAANSGAT